MFKVNFYYVKPMEQTAIYSHNQTIQFWQRHR